VRGSARGWADAIRLQLRCQARVRTLLPLPDPFDLDGFCADLARRRGRPLRVLPVSTGRPAGAVCGAWVPLPEEDVLVVEADTTPWHREQIVLHEIGHMLCDHPLSPQAAAAAWAQRAFPHLDPEMVTTLLARSSYESPAEREAEMTASLIESRIRRRVVSAPAAPTAPGELADVLGQLARALGSSG
jgi:hypothetical protein